MSHLKTKRQEGTCQQIIPRTRKNSKGSYQEYSKVCKPFKEIVWLHREYCETLGIPTITESFYRYIFTHHFNARFKKPYTDTCSLCDKL